MTLSVTLEKAKGVGGRKGSLIAKRVSVLCSPKLCTFVRGFIFIINFISSNIRGCIALQSWVLM